MATPGHRFLGPRCREGSTRGGLHHRYEHAFGLDHALGALMLGSVLIGTNWYSLMSQPASNGEVKITPMRGSRVVMSTRSSVSTRSVAECGAIRAGDRTGVSEGGSGFHLRLLITCCEKRVKGVCLAPRHPVPLLARERDDVLFHVHSHTDLHFLALQHKADAERRQL